MALGTGLQSNAVNYIVACSLWRGLVILSLRIHLLRLPEGQKQ